MGMLDALGMDPRAEDVYRLLMGRPDWGVAQIAAHLGEPQARVHRLLDLLIDLRLVVEQEDPPMLRPVHPHIGLAALVARGEADLGRRRQEIDAMRAALQQLSAAFHAGGGFPEDVIERLDGLDAVRARLVDLAHTARAECLSLLTGGAQLPDAMLSSKPLDQLALERGVDIRSVYQDSYRNDAATAAYVRWLASMGGQTRATPMLPMQLVVVDREIALVPIDPHDGRRGALEVRSLGIVAALCELFELIWRGARPWDAEPVLDEHGLNEQQRELVRLLAGGETDEVVARRLGLSVRTVRRMTAQLMQRLGAHSRFQAGVYAAHRRWI